MSKPLSVFVVPRLLLALLATSSVSTVLTTPTFAQGTKDSGGATTFTSKQKVNIIVDREKTAERSTLLVKIIVPNEAKVEAFALADPPRLVVDFMGVATKASETFQAPKNTVVKQFRLGAHPEKLRIVMDLLTTEPPVFEWKAGPRQALLRISESGPLASAPASAPVATAVPTSVPTEAPTQAPTTPPTAAPSKTPTSTATPAATKEPTPPPTTTPTPMPTFSATPTPEPTKAPPSRPEPQAKLPDIDDKALEAALDQEISKASAALARGEEIDVNAGLEGEDLVDVPATTESTTAGDEELEIPEDEPQAKAVAQKEVPPQASIVARDLPSVVTQTSPAAAKPESLGSLRANPVPAAPITDFMIESASYDYLEPGHRQAFRFTLSKPGAQAQVSKVDAITYKIIIPKCGLATLGLALPQYPPADYKGLVLVAAQAVNDSVEVTAQIEQGSSLTTFLRDKDIWIKTQ